jgi:hypothetical protein
MTTTTTAITPVAIPFPSIDVPHLRISAGGCRLRITPGDAEPWVAGSYEDRSGRMPLHIQHDADGVRLGVGTEVAEFFHLFEAIPILDIKLGTAHPFALSIDVGASEDVFDFGGVPLERLALSNGAGKVTVGFSQSNPVQMELLKLSVGAGALEAHGLGNAGASDMLVEGGAAGVQLDFDGTFARECHVRISTALAGVDVCIPSSVAAEVSSSSLLGGADVDAGFTRRGETYCTRAVADGASPMLFIYNTTAFGGIRLRTPAAPVVV